MRVFLFHCDAYSYFKLTDVIFPEAKCFHWGTLTTQTYSTQNEFTVLHMREKSGDLRKKEESQGKVRILTVCLEIKVNHFSVST